VEVVQIRIILFAVNQLNAIIMYYVILNHTNPTVSLMVDSWGCIIKFKFLKAAIQAAKEPLMMEMPGNI